MTTPNSTAVVAATLQPLAVDYAEAARLCGLSVDTISKAVKAGELRAARIGRAVRIRIPDLDAWLVSLTQTSEAS